jgi:hypothetical protein
MLSIEKSLQILNSGKKKYTEHEAQEILDTLSELAAIEYTNYQNLKNESSNLSPSID